jgi:hypothetical protein
MMNVRSIPSSEDMAQISLTITYETAYFSVKCAPQNGIFHRGSSLNRCKGTPSDTAD